MTPLRWAIVGGVAVGFAYTLSPLTVLFVALLVPLGRWASAGLTGTERRWIMTVFAVAVAIRFAAIAGLFMTADPDIPYANFFGDEEFFKRKTTWLRNVAMGIPISTADWIYAFDQTGDNSYVRVLTYLQALVGLAPYGVHVFNSGCYLVAAVVLYRVARPSFGGFAAFAGLCLLLFLPSLFIWSVSALKEPLYFLIAALNLTAAVTLVRAPGWWRRLGAVVVIAIGAVALQGLREGGLALASAGIIGGFVLAYVAQQRRRLVVAVVIAPLVIGLALTRPAVQDRALGVVHQAALKHWGHINTPGQTYKLLDPHFYVDRTSVANMRWPDAARFVGRAVWSYATVPLPWRVESRSQLAFLPEQMVWFVLLVLTAFGIAAALRRDVLLTSLLLAHGCAAAVMVALSGGNVGTLVRHRGLTIPYFAWLAGVALAVICETVLSGRSPRPAADSNEPDSKAGLAWR